MNDPDADPVRQAAIPRPDGTPAVGVFLPTLTAPGAAPLDAVAAAQHAEQLGFESIWAIDQLVAGAGAPLVDSVVALSAAAGATRRIRLGFGVMILPLRPVVWVAKQVASLQAVSGDRALLGVGVGGDRHDLSWRAAGVPRRQRGARTDRALEVLPSLLRGEPTVVDTVTGAEVQLSPGVAVPPVLVGGTAPAALRRVVEHGDGWFTMPVPPETLATQVDELRRAAIERGRPAPSITGSVTVALDGDPELPSQDQIARALTDPDGIFGMPAAAVGSILVTGGGDELRRRVQGWASLGAERIVLTLAAGDWHRQLELVAEALDERVPA